jgi:riboflavin kinase/FMN adenylyltransferase
MRIFNSFEEASCIQNPVVTTGTFDGVHVGHMAIIKRLNDIAEKYHGESVLITFNPHPRKILYPDTIGKNLKLINSQTEKVELLRKTGLQNVVIVEFTLSFSKITGEEFIRDWLCGKLHAKVIVAGFNHHFGFNHEGDYRQIWSMREKYNFEAEEIPEQDVENESVSSTRIREAVSKGYIQKANAYLDHYYFITGKTSPYACNDGIYPVSLAKFPVTDETKLLPTPGIYATTFRSEAKLSRSMVIINQLKPGETEILIHLFDDRIDPYSSDSTLYFHKKVQGALNTEEKTCCFQRVKAALEEISELIY